MKLNKITINKKQLSLIPERERTLLIQIGHLSNEISFFHKLLIISYKKSDSDIERKVHTSQASIIARVYIGKLFEGWQILKENFIDTELFKEYEPKLPDPGRLALQNLMKYFGTRNLIVKIRNNFSFHFPSQKLLKRQFEMIEDSAEFLIFIAEEIANSHYYMSEEIVSQAMLNMVDAGTLQEAMDIIYRDLLEVSKWLVDFNGNCLVAILDRYFELDQFEIEAIEVGEPPKINEITIPFFTSK